MPRTTTGKAKTSAGNKYTIEIFWSDADKGFIGVASALPGCSAFGDTRVECAKEMELAIKGWLQACKAAGNKLP